MVKKTSLPETWTYSGCYADAIAERDTGATGVEIDSSTAMTAECCLESCFARGHTAAGTEYSSQCFCGMVESFTAVNPMILGEGSCDMVCSGDETELCGGAGAISFYVLG